LEGFLEPNQTIEIAAPEPGLLQRLLIQEGQTVQAGELVAELNNDVLEAALQVARKSSQAQGKLDSTQAELRLAETLLHKLADLQSRGAATAQEIERATVERDVAAAHRLAAEEEVAIRRLEAARIEREIEIRRLRSPISGVVTRKWKDPGEYVSPAEPIVATVVQLDPLVAVFAVPQSALVEVKPQSSVSIVIGDQAVETLGTVHFVSPLVDPRSGTLEVKVHVPNPKGEWHSGVRCRLLVRTPTPAAPLPPRTAGAAAPAKPVLPIVSSPVN
jgi:RND family efflux transporter MFP subunit